MIPACGPPPSGPLAPEIYQYNFVVDGVRILDPGNPHLKNGRALDASIVEVPGNPPRFDELQAVPHGALHIRTYLSTPLNKAAPSLRLHAAAVRRGTQPSLSRSSICATAAATTKRTGATPAARASSWTTSSRNTKPYPCSLSCPTAIPTAPGPEAVRPQGIELLTRELLSDIIPMIDRTYRVAPGRENRAITGLSMGGGQAFTMGLKHLDLFAWVGEFSSGLVSDTRVPPGPVPARLPGSPRRRKPEAQAFVSELRHRRSPLPGTARSRRQSEAAQHPLRLVSHSGRA